MPVVTDIKQQLKRHNRYSIYLDGSYAFSLAEDQLVISNLSKGAELTAAEVTQLQGLSDYGKALDRAYNYLSYRDRSADELVRYLEGKDYDSPTVQQVVERLKSEGSLNDERFAEQWVQERTLYRHASKRKIYQELMQKGIGREIIDEALSKVNNQDQQATIRQLIQAKQLMQKYQDERKLIQYLRGKGFRYSDITAAIQEIHDTG